MTDEHGNLNLVEINHISYIVREKCIRKSNYFPCKYLIKWNSMKIAKLEIMKWFLNIYAITH